MEQKSTQALIREAQLEEYRTLRQEILDLEKIQHDISLFIFTGVSAIYAVAFSSKEIYLLFIAYMILIPLRCRHIFYHEMVAKAATYISDVIEKNIEGLNWESRTHQGTAEDSKAKNEFSSCRLHYYMYSIIAGGTALVISLYAIADSNAPVYGKFGIIASAIFLSLVVLRYDLLFVYQSSHVRDYYSQVWTSMFKK